MNSSTKIFCGGIKKEISWNFSYDAYIKFLRSTRTCEEIVCDLAMEGAGVCHCGRCGGTRLRAMKGQYEESCEIMVVIANYRTG